MFQRELLDLLHGGAPVPERAQADAEDQILPADKWGINCHWKELFQVLLKIESDSHEKFLNVSQGDCLCIELFQVKIENTSHEKFF